MADTEIVVVNPTSKSKINLAQIIAIVAMLGSYFGLDFSPEFQAALLLVIGVVTEVATIIIRTYFNGRAPTVPELKAAAKAEDLVVVPLTDVKASAQASVT